MSRRMCSFLLNVNISSAFSRLERFQKSAYRAAQLIKFKLASIQPSAMNRSQEAVINAFLIWCYPCRMYPSKNSQLSESTMMNGRSFHPVCYRNTLSSTNCRQCHFTILPIITGVRIVCLLSCTTATPPPHHRTGLDFIHSASHHLISGDFSHSLTFTFTSQNTFTHFIYPTPTDFIT